MIPVFSSQEKRPSNRHAEAKRVDSLDVQAEFAADIDSTDDMGTLHSIFSPGIHVWCINVIHDPLRVLQVDLRHDFLIEWRGFDLRGQPL
jgi:hypothetical protein